jgi:hypothetical protein
MKSALIAAVVSAVIAGTTANGSDHRRHLEEHQERDDPDR